MCQWSILQHSVYQFRIAWIDRSVWGKIPCWQRMACWGFEFWMSQVPKAILVYESPKSSQLECSQWGIGSQGKGKSGHLSLEEPICHSWQQWSMTRKLFSNNTSFISFFSFVKSCWTPTSTTRGGFLFSTPMPSLPVRFACYSHYGEFLDSSISYPRTTASKFIL